MSANLINIIFGMKVRQARTEAGMTLSKFAKKAKLSPSYATEIEKGRKYPRADKIMKMAEVLERDYDDLVSIKLSPSLAYLESTLSSAILRRFPFEEFGFEAEDLVHLLTREPEKASALLHAILEFIRRYDLQEEDFLRAALRSYQEIHENYFPELEEAALAFTAVIGQKYGLSANSPPDRDTLETILRQEYGCQIDETTIGENEALGAYRSVFVPEERPFPEKRPSFYINDKLFARQIKFLLARELGYQYLGLKERSLTSTPDRIDSFGQLMNDFKAAYFGGALLMPREVILEDIRQFFGMTTWNPQPLQDMLAKFDVTPEMLFYRFSELIPQAFGVQLHFMRFHRSNGRFQLIKHLNMNRLLVPSGIGLYEHYCRRWLSVRLMRQIENDAPTSETTTYAPPAAQISEFLESGERFLSFGFARSMVLTPGVTSSVIVGFRVDEKLKQTVGFCGDTAVPTAIINETCERCPLT
ncbi:MAG: helix-turn-helix domain-containing protein, partial [Chloroflexi bacterium]|nr:helix-turn-helix domain-containing protein [Chloroflexota bacterium]